MREVRERCCAADLVDDDFLSFAGEVHQSRRVFLRLDVMEARVSTAFQQPVYPQQVPCKPRLPPVNH